MRRWRAKTGDRWNVYRRNRYASNPQHAEKIKAAVKKWREDNHAEWLERHKSHEARRRGAEGKFTKADIVRLWDAQGGVCVYCSADLEVSVEVDHIQPISRGGTNWPNNIQLLCHSCNRHKSAMTDAEFRATMEAS